MRKFETSVESSSEDYEIILPELCLVKVEILSSASDGPAFYVVSPFGEAQPITDVRTLHRLRLRHQLAIRIPAGVVAQVDVKELTATERRDDLPPPPPPDTGNSLIARIRARARAEAGGLRENFESRYELDDDDPGYMEEQMLEVASQRAHEAAQGKPPLDNPANPDNPPAPVEPAPLAGDNAPPASSPAGS